jgi:hypothetical protein
MTNPKKKDNKKNKIYINQRIVHDISNNIITKPHFDPLQHSKENKNIVIQLGNNCDKKKYINKSSLIFIMKFNKVIDEVKNNRRIHEKNVSNDGHKKIVSALDNTINSVTNKTNQQDIDLVLGKLNGLYNNWDINRKIKSDNESKNFHFFQKPNGVIQPWVPNKPWEPNKPVQNGTTQHWEFNKPIQNSIIPPWESNEAPCDWSPPEQSVPIMRTKVVIDREIDGLDDILRLIKDFPLKLDIEYNINMKALHDIKSPLEDLNEMVGMQTLKDSIVDQIVFFAQDLHKGNDFMHTVIYGPPGTGKTEIAKIMGKIFSSIGILKNNKFRKVTRSDLIAGYLGQTAIKTRDVITDCLGGVLFIDEAYALGNREKRDSFAKECIDTLCEALSDNKEQLMVIIAGYEEDLNKCFFAYNQGLNSRFPWRFHTDNYKADELNLIFQKKVKEIGWSLKTMIADEWFEEKMDYFKYFGRDIETLLAKIKIAHGRRVFCKAKSEKRVLITADINKGFTMFIDNNEVKNRKGMKNEMSHMYI